MQAIWHYAEGGKSRGPATVEEIRAIMAAGRPSLLVWTQGLPQWTQASDLPEFAASRRVHPASRRDDAPVPGQKTLAQRAKHELIEYLAISAYLAICFGALVGYRAAILRSVGVEFAPYGLAIIKALICGKFLMLLQALKLGERRQRVDVPLIAILRKASLFTVFLIALNVLEELIMGHIHGKEAAEILSQLGGGTIPQALMLSVLMLLILIPYFAYREIAPELLKPVDQWNAEPEAQTMAAARERLASTFDVDDGTRTLN